MFSGSGEVENVMIGGPAHLSNTIFRGDVIVEVDGQTVAGDSLLRAIIGEDIPGSYLNLKLQRGGGIVDVTLTRISTADVADKRRMFDLFTTLNDRAKKDNDPEVAKCVQESLLLWEKMMVADQIHDDRIQENVESMQADCLPWSNEISFLLLDIWNRQNWEHLGELNSAPDVSFRKRSHVGAGLWTIIDKSKENRNLNPTTYP